MVLATRSARVSGFLPSSIHRAYSLRCVKGSFWYAAWAAGFSARAWVSSGGSTTTRSSCDEFDLHLIAHPDPEPSQQVLPEA